ncbi:CheR family methyltransferase, partial [Kibdelosporangium lantanae]
MLTYLKETRGFDFTGYKRTSLARRVLRRMSQVGIEDFGEYIDLLQASADEFEALFNTILINVTSFFRDTEAWQHLREEMVPMMLAERGPDDPIRIWSAGCATGQEATFTLYQDHLAMYAAYDQAVAESRNGTQTNCPRMYTTERRYPDVGPMRGHVVCHVRDGVTTVIWTDEDSVTLGRARAGSIDLRD